MLHRFSVISSLALAVTCIAPFAHAQYTYFPNNATINSAIQNDALIGYANDSDYNASPRLNPSSPTVSIVTGASIARDVDVRNSSIVNMSGGFIGRYLAARDNSIVNMSGGRIVIVYTDTNSVFNLRGGLVDRYLDVEGNGTLNIYGTNLSALLVDPNNDGGRTSLYNFSGTLQDGTQIPGRSLVVQNGTGARFTLNNVPAPGSLLTALIGVVPGVMLLRRRRKSVR